MTGEIKLRKTVADVIAIIGRGKARADEIERAVRAAKQPPRPELWPPYPLTKADKRAARSIASALGRLERTLGYTNFRAVAYRAAHDEFQEWEAQLKKWRRRFEGFAGDLKPEGPTFFPDRRRGWPLGHAKKSTDRLIRKRKAVEAAAEILEAHHLALTVTPISGTRTGSSFCRVAAVIYGERNVAHQCRAYLARKRGAK